MLPAVRWHPSTVLLPRPDLETAEWTLKLCHFRDRIVFWINSIIEVYENSLINLLTALIDTSDIRFFILPGLLLFLLFLLLVMESLLINNYFMTFKVNLQIYRY